MKIALIVRKVSTSGGGVERVSVSLSRKLSEAGHEVHIFTSYSETEIAGVHIRLIKGAGLLGKLFSPWKLLSFQMNVADKLKRERFDIVYSLCQVFPVDIYRAGGGVHRYWMQIQHPNKILRWIKYLTSLVHITMVWLENRIFKKGNCKLIITNSRFIKNKIIECFHVPDEKVRVIYNGVDHQTFNPGVGAYRKAMREKYMIGEDEIVLLFVANDWERKGLLTIIRAIPKTGIDKLRLVVVGRGKKCPYVSLAKSKKIKTDKLIFAGHSKSIEKYYGMADIFVFPTRYDPFSNVCLEGMACGLPVITTRTNGASEIITDSENGFIIDDWSDSDKLAEIIKNLSEKNRHKEIGEKAAETAKNYTWDRHIEETTRLLDLVAGS